MKVNTVKCPICDSSKVSEKLKNASSYEHSDLFSILICRACQIIFTSPQPTKYEIQKYYDIENYWGYDPAKEVEINTEKQKSKYTYLLGQILQENKSGKILDIGAGDGSFLKLAFQYGLKGKGIEISEVMRKVAKKKKIDLVKDWTQLPKEEFETIVFLHSLEHIYDPIEYLREARERLTKNGSIYVVVPNIDSLGFFIFRDNWWSLQLPKHLYHYNASSLKNIFSQAKLRTIYYDFGFYEHNYYSLFQSIRYKFSGNFIPTSSKNKTQKSKLINNKPSLLKKYSIKLGEYGAKCLTIIGEKSKKSEVIIVKLKKDNE